MKQILDTIQALHSAGVDPECINPNFVADFAFNRQINLLSNEVVFVFDVYGCPLWKQLAQEEVES